MTRTTAELRLDRLPPPAAALLRAVARAAPRGAEPALVGGAVRDALLDRPVVDLDVTVASGAIELAGRLAERLAGTCVVLDAARGAARVVVGGRRLDLTDHRAPGLEADLALRDFTVNALAVPLGRLLSVGRGPIVDPTGGVADARARRLRPPSARVLRDDPLRALRAVRFEATLGLRLTPAAARAVRAAVPGLAGVAPERVRDELVLVLGASDTRRALERADALGVLSAILPETTAMRATAQPAPHRFDVLEHSLRAVGGVDRLLAGLDRLSPHTVELAADVGEPLGGGLDRGRALKVAALLHDVAKPETRRRVRGGVRFIGHDVVGAERAQAIAERWRLPSRVTEVVRRLVRHHLRPMHLENAGTITPRARYRFYRELGGDTRDLLLLVLADAAAVTGTSPFETWHRSWAVRDLLAGMQPAEAAQAAPPLVTGHDVMSRLGLAPGPRVGWLLARAREAQALGRIRSRDEALAYLDSLRSDH